MKSARERQHEGHDVRGDMLVEDTAEVGHHDRVPHEAIEAFFAPGRPRTASFENSQVFDFEGLKGRLLSSSYAPLPDHPNHGPMLAALRELFDRHARDGRVTFEYDTRVFHGRLV